MHLPLSEALDCKPYNTIDMREMAECHIQKYKMRWRCLNSFNEQQQPVLVESLIGVYLFLFLFFALWFFLNC